MKMFCNRRCRGFALRFGRKTVEYGRGNAIVPSSEQAARGAVIATGLASWMGNR